MSVLHVTDVKSSYQHPVPTAPPPLPRAIALRTHMQLAPRFTHVQLAPRFTQSTPGLFLDQNSPGVLTNTKKQQWTSKKITKNFAHQLQGHI
jgi:inner membrane protein involved in colicin E2 resistance